MAMPPPPPTRVAGWTMVANLADDEQHPDWLKRAGVRLFVSRRALGRYKTLPRAVAPWALDSGGFTELTLHGRWTLSAREWAAEARRLGQCDGRDFNPGRVRDYACTLGR